MSTDSSWFHEINDFAARTPWLHGAATAYALWGGLTAMVLLVAIGWWRARRRVEDSHAVATVALVGVAAVLAVLINQHVVSPEVARPRPCASMSHVEVLLTCGKDYSMPSDHCVIAEAIAAGLWVVHRVLAATATALALLLAFTRVYVGVHYPSDTAVGLLMGAVVAVLVLVSLRRPAAELAGRLSRGRLRALVVARR